MIKLSSVQRVLPVGILLVCLSITYHGPPPAAECFWLTDGISLQTADFIGPSPRPQAEPAPSSPGASAIAQISRAAEVAEKIPSVQDAQPTAKQPSVSQPSSNAVQQQQQQQQQQQSGSKNESPNSIQSVVEEGTNGRPVQQQQQQQQQLANCQCNPDWLQNQTNSWLNKWLSSPHFANQLKTYASNGLMVATNMMSNSTGATPATNSNHGHNNHPRRDAKQQHQHQLHRQHNSSSSNHLSAWIRAKGNSNSNNNKNNNNNNSEARGNHNATNRPAGMAKGNGGGGKWVRDSGQHQHNAAGLSGKLIPGERGPKGDQGPRGERGPSGLISVKDRDALFDLGTNPSSSGTMSGPSADHNNDSNSARQPDGLTAQTGPRARLVFVESEQMLVVDTASGWRPVQMLAPLRDFRKTVAKYNLNNPEDRRRLLILNAQQNSILAPAAAVADISNARHRMRPIMIRAEDDGDDDSTMASFNSLTNMLRSRGGGNAIDEDPMDLGDEDDDDEEEDDDDDHDLEGADGSNDIDQSGDDDDGDDDEDDDDDADDDDDDAASGSDVNELIIANDDGDPEAAARTSNSLMATTASTAARRRVAAGQGASRLAGDEKRGRRLLQVASRSALSSPMQAASSENSMPGTREQSHGTAATTNKWAKVSISDDQDDDADHASDGDNTMKLRLIALNEPYSGNVHGLRGANFECRRHATKANIKGAFRAFLATNYQNLNEVMRHNAAQKYPIVNLRGEILAGSWHDLLKQPARMPNPLSRIYSFDGRHVATDSNWPNKLVWHGSGNKLGHRDSAHDCDGWHSDSLNKFGFASPLHPPRTHFGSGAAPQSKRQQHKRNHQKRYLFEASSSHNQSSTLADGQPVLDAIEKYPCRMPLIVLCIETIAQAD